MLTRIACCIHHNLVPSHTVHVHFAALFTIQKSKWLEFPPWTKKLGKCIFYLRGCPKSKCEYFHKCSKHTSRPPPLQKVYTSKKNQGQKLPYKLSKLGWNVESIIKWTFFCHRPQSCPSPPPPKKKVCTLMKILTIMVSSFIFII